MRRTELAAILCGAGPPDGHASCRVIRTERHAAILRAAPLLRPNGRASVLRAAADHARLLEGLMAFGTVLPALPGQRIREPEVARLVTANLPMLARLEDMLSGRAQYQVTVRWDAGRAPAHFGGSAQTGPDALARDLRARIDAQLNAIGAETLALPVAGEMISNHAILLDRASEDALDAAVEGIDAIWSEGFAVRMVGPYPGVSFASLAFDRIEATSVRAARAAFALAPGFSEEALRSARRSAMLGAPDAVQERLRRQAEVLACAARLGGSDGPVHVMRMWSEGMAAPSVGEARAA